MKKNIFFCYLITLTGLAYSQSPPKYKMTPYAFVTKNNDTVICKKGGWAANYKYMKCDGEKIDFKTLIRYGAIFDLCPIDIDKPDGDQELRLARIPEVLYTDTNKVAVIVSFEKDENVGGKVNSYGGMSGTSLSMTIDEKPACFEFIKKQIQHDMDSLKLKPVVFLNDGKESLLIRSFTDKRIAESKANVIMEYKFYKSPRNGAAEKGKAELGDYSQLVISIHKRLGNDSYQVYASEEQTRGDKRFDYRKTWRKFLIDYEKCKAKNK